MRARARCLITAAALVAAAGAAPGYEDVCRLPPGIESFRVAPSPTLPDSDLARLDADLASAEPKERGDAVERLGRSRDPRAVPRLSVRALEDGSEVVRQVAVRWLGRLQAPASIETLQAAAGDPDDQVREEAVWSLGLGADSADTETLVAALGDPNAVVRQVAACGLGRAEDERALVSLSYRLDDGNGFVAAAAAWAIARITGADANGPGQPGARP